MVAREVKAGAEYSEISDARKSTFCSELRGDLATLTAVGCTAPAGPCGGPAHTRLGVSELLQSMPDAR